MTDEYPRVLSADEVRNVLHDIVVGARTCRAALRYDESTVINAGVPWWFWIQIPQGDVESILEAEKVLVYLVNPETEEVLDDIEPPE